MAHFKIITGDKCPFCDKAKALLIEKEHSFDESHVLDKTEIMKKLGLSKVPQIFLVTDSKGPPVYIGGYTDLVSYFDNIDRKYER